MTHDFTKQDTAIHVGPLTFARFAEPVGSKRKSPRWVWYGGEPCSAAEITRRAEMLLKYRVVSGT